MQYCQDKDINRLVAEMIRTGWRFERGRHGKLRHPDGAGFITMPKTPATIDVCSILASASNSAKKASNPTDQMERFGRCCLETIER